MDWRKWLVSRRGDYSDLSNQPHVTCCHENVTICPLVCANHLNFLSLEGGTLFIWKTKFDIPMLLNILLVRSHQLASFGCSLRRVHEPICARTFLHVHTLWFLDACLQKNSKFVGCACLIIIILGHVCKTLGILSKFIAIGTQLFEIYDVLFVILFAILI